VKNGRVKVQTIASGETYDEVNWFTWARVEENGSFVIDAWPKDTPMQLIALCDGFIAKSGEKPPMVTPERARRSYWRAQVFLEPDSSEVVVEMTPMQMCHIKVENAFGKGIKDCHAGANPNIGWWNGGSQIYGWPLVKCGDFLLTGEYKQEESEGIFAKPFGGESDQNGEVSFQLPVGKTSLWIGNDRYQLAINNGRRTKRIEIESGKSLDLKVVLQPKGLDVLGDWEDLCGLVFG